MGKESLRKMCKDILEKRVMSEMKLDFISTSEDERHLNGFYHEEPNITYPKKKVKNAFGEIEYKSEPFFIAEIGTKDNDKHKIFTAKFYVWGAVGFIKGYESKVSKEVAQMYYQAIEDNKKEVERKRKFELVYV